MSLRLKIKTAIWQASRLGPETTWAITDAVMAVLRPVEAVEHSKAVILYLPTEADREELIAAIREAKPGMVAVKVD